MTRTIAAAACAACLLLGACAPTRPPVLSKPPETPPTVDDLTARMEKALAVSNITVADVATFVGRYGWALVPASDWRGWHWRPSTGQVTYYVATIRAAVVDTLLPIYFKTDPAGAYNVQVEAIKVNPDGTIYARSPKSDLGWSDGTGAGALPGVAPPAP